MAGSVSAAAAWGAGRTALAVRQVQTPMPHPFRREPRFVEEADRLMAAAETLEEKLCVCGLLETGLQASELTNLRPPDIQWQLPSTTRPLQHPYDPADYEAGAYRFGGNRHVICLLDGGAGLADLWLAAVLVPLEVLPEQAGQLPRRLVEGLSIAHVSRGIKISGGTPGASVTTCRPKTGSVARGASFSAPEWIASMIARVCGRSIRLPTP